MDPENEKEEETPTFKVSDRRKFTAEGELRPDTPEQPPASERFEAHTSPPPQSAGSQPGIGSQPSAGRAGSEAETLDFGSFLISLATTGMVHLGEIPDPVSGKPAENLEGAQQMIDILSMLQEKTRGNRSSEEDRLLDGLLFELRMKFLNKQKAKKL